MRSFMSKYLEGLITSEEIKKHGLTQADLMYIKDEYMTFENMLKQYQSSIFGKKDKSGMIQKELKVASKMAELLSFLGKSFSDYVDYVHKNVVEMKENCLERSLSDDYYKTINFIAYMLSRQQENYGLSTLYYHAYYSEIERRNIIVDNVSLLAKEHCRRFTNYYGVLGYLDYLYGERKSFIVNSTDTYHGERDLYNCSRELLKNSDVALLGTNGGDTLCFLGDDTFRNMMTRLMLFGDLHGFRIGDINKENQEEYAQAIESMDISSYSIEKDQGKRFYIAKKKN